MSENMLRLVAKVKGYQLHRFGATSKYIVYGNGKTYEFPTLAIAGDFLTGKLK